MGCNIEGQLRCEGQACGDNDKGERYKGVCDKDGCDINPHRMGNTSFYGRGSDFLVDTLKPVTTVTQVGECKSFCAQALDNWSVKCSWHCCAGCPSCTATTTTTTTAAPNPSKCKKSCADRAKTKPWSKLCKRDNCRGCAECGPPKRRLRASTNFV